MSHDDLIARVESTYLRNELTAEGRDLLSLVSTRLRMDAARVRKLEAERDSYRDALHVQVGVLTERAERAEAERDAARRERNAIDAALRERDRQVIALRAENERLRTLLREAEPYARVERWGKPGCNLADRINAALKETP